MKDYITTEEQKAKFEFVAKIVGYPISTENQCGLALAGASRRVVEADQFPAEYYLMFHGKKQLITPKSI